MDPDETSCGILYFKPFITTKYTKPIHFESNSEEYIVISTNESVFKYSLKSGAGYTEIHYPKTFKPVNHVAIINRSSGKLYLCGGKDKGFAVLNLRTNEIVVKTDKKYGAPMNATWLSGFCIANNANTSMNGLHLFGFDSHFLFDLDEEIWINMKKDVSLKQSTFSIPYFVESKGIIFNHEYQSTNSCSFCMCNIFDELMIFVDGTNLQCFSLHTFEFSPTQSWFKEWMPQIKDMFVSNDLYVHFADFKVHWQCKIKISNLIPEIFYQKQKSICQRIVHGFVRLMIKCLQQDVSTDIVKLIFNFYTVFV